MGRPGERTARPSKKNPLLQPIIQLRNGHSALSKGKNLFLPLPQGKARPGEHGQLPISALTQAGLEPPKLRGLSPIYNQTPVYLFIPRGCCGSHPPLPQAREAPPGSAFTLPSPPQARPRGSWATTTQTPLRGLCRSRIGAIPGSGMRYPGKEAGMELSSPGGWLRPQRSGCSVRLSVRPLVPGCPTRAGRARHRPCNAGPR